MRMRTDLYYPGYTPKTYPVGITCSKLTIQTPEQSEKYGVTIKIPERRQAVFIVNFEYISHLVLVFVLLI